MEETLSYEEALSQLQAIVKKLENKEVKIDELAGTVARANELVDTAKLNCKQQSQKFKKS